MVVRYFVILLNSTFIRSNFVPFFILSCPEHKVLSSAGYRSSFTTLHVRLCRRTAFGLTKLWNSFCYGLDISILHWIRSFTLSTMETFESPSTDLRSGPATGTNRTTSSNEVQFEQSINPGGYEQEIYYAKNIFCRFASVWTYKSSKTFVVKRFHLSDREVSLIF